MPDRPQTFASHRRLLPPWHFFVMPVLAIHFVAEVVAAVRYPSVDTVWGAVVALAIVTGLLCARWMPLRVQNRVIRLEERLRLARLLPGREEDVARLTLDQLIGLRFAADPEVGALVDRCLAGSLRSRGDVKRAIRDWRPDYLRV